MMVHCVKLYVFMEVAAGSGSCGLSLQSHYTFHVTDVLSAGYTIRVL
jgi:hypothetical protein